MVDPVGAGVPGAGDFAGGGVDLVDHGVSPILGQVEGLFPLVCLTTINIHTNQIPVKPYCVTGVMWG